MQHRWSPYETLELDSEEGETPFASIHHCLWFSIASWVQQGCDFLPRYEKRTKSENLARISFLNIKIHECNFKHEILEILSKFCVNLNFYGVFFSGPFHRGQWPVFGGFSHSS